MIAVPLSLSRSLPCAQMSLIFFACFSLNRTPYTLLCLNTQTENHIKAKHNHRYAIAKTAHALIELYNKWFEANMQHIWMLSPSLCLMWFTFLFCITTEPPLRRAKNLTAMNCSQRKTGKHETTTNRNHRKPKLEVTKIVNWNRIVIDLSFKCVLDNLRQIKERNKKTCIGNFSVHSHTHTQKYA